jgi:hypothetical protein
MSDLIRPLRAVAKGGSGDINLLATRAANEIERLETALLESVKLQSHYAALLNQYDGGKRITFKDGNAWIARLDELKPRPNGLSVSGEEEGVTDNHFLKPDNDVTCEWCGTPFDDHGYEQQARYCYPAQIKVFKSRLRELIALMEGDIAFKSIEAGATRKLILADARKLVPDMPPAKTLDEILATPSRGADVETKTDAS